MLRLYDTRSGQVAPVSVARPGELWIQVSGPDLGRRPHLGDLRADLLGDLIRRCAQRRGLVVTVYETVTAADEPSLAALRADRAALNIYPADRTFPGSEPITRLAESARPGWTSEAGPAFDLAAGRGTGQQSPSVAGAAAHHAAPTGPVAVDGREVADPAEDPADGIVWLSDVTDLGLDPLALRLAFLRHRYREPANLTWDWLLGADRTLRRWRDAVAAWATEPSAPLARPYADAVLAAFEDDLDTATALRHLHALEADNAVPPGGKFETFAYLDYLLGLDLAREIGRY